jgi:hypothetical protein
MIHVWKITVIIEVTVISERQAKRENWSGEDAQSRQSSKLYLQSRFLKFE